MIRRLAFLAVLAVAGCNSTATLPANDPSKSWSVSHAGGSGGPPAQTASAAPFWGNGSGREPSGGSAGIPTSFYSASAGRETFTRPDRPASFAAGPRVEAVPVPGVSAVSLEDRTPPKFRPSPAEAAPAADLERVSGKLKVVDATVVEIGGEALRLHGIRRPKPEERCGETSCDGAARRWLTEKAEGKVVSCERQGLAATCALEGKDLGEALVRAGLVRTADAAYREAEQVARQSGAGLWAAQ